MFDWLLAFHIVAIILWMGGLFQLSRHLGIHTAEADGEAIDAFVDYEYKTYYFVVLPGFLVALGTGLYMLVSKGFGHYLASDVWGGTFHLKLLLIALLIGGDQTVHYQMRSLHESGEGNRGLFMAVHGLVALFFIVIVVAVKTRLFA